MTMPLFLGMIVIALLLLPVALKLFQLLISSAKHWGLIDRPGGRRIHANPVAVIGGLGVLTAWFAGLVSMALIFPEWQQAHLQSFLVTGACVFAVLAVGIVDDRGGVTPAQRLAVEVVVAAVTVMFLPDAQQFCQELSPYFGWVAYPLTLVGIIGVMNSMNLVDGMDGLAGSMFFFIAVTVGYLTGIPGALPSFSFVSVLMLLPGLLVFLRHNWSPARTFMGDHGSLTVGYLLVTASLGIRVGIESHSWVDLSVLAILFSYPVLDMLVCMYRRRRASQAMTIGDRNHMHHRMLRLGLSASESVGNLIAWQLVMLCPVFFSHSVAIERVPLLLIPTIAFAAERLFFLGRVELARVRFLQSRADSLMAKPISIRSSDTSVVVREVVVSLRPLIEASLFEERGALNQAVDALRFFCERKVKGRGFVRISVDQIIICLFEGSDSNETEAQVCSHWSEALAVFSHAYMFTYSTFLLPVSVRTPERPAHLRAA